MPPRSIDAFCAKFEAIAHPVEYVAVDDGRPEITSQSLAWESDELRNADDEKDE